MTLTSMAWAIGCVTHGAEELPGAAGGCWSQSNVETCHCVLIVTGTCIIDVAVRMEGEVITP